MNTANTLSKLYLRPPDAVDAAEITALIRRCPPLEPNTTYAYLLFSTHFAETSVVAEDDGQLLGCIVGYQPPQQPDTVFVWQVCVDPEVRGKRLGARMLDALADRLHGEDVRYVEATVAPSNTASDKLFRQFALHRDVPCITRPHFAPHLFGSEAHEEELLYRIGPLLSPNSENLIQ